MNRLKESCVCDKDNETTDVSCPYHGQEALKSKLGYYCTSCGGSGWAKLVHSFRKNAKTTNIRCPFCRD